MSQLGLISTDEIKSHSTTGIHGPGGASLPTAAISTADNTTSRYGPGALAEMEAALREDRGMAEDAVT